jgi:tetratricopeptide (TPR) repeat protein
VLAAIAGLVPGPTNPYYTGDTKRFATAVEVAHASFDPQSVALRTRIGYWRRGLRMWRAHPLFGVGAGNFPIAFPPYAEPGATRDFVMTPTQQPRQAHNDVVERLADTGLVGLAAFFFLIAATALVARRRLRAGDPAVKYATAASAAALVALLGSGVTGFPLEMPATIALAGMALGLIAPGAMNDRLSPDQPESAAPPSLARARAARAALAVAVVWLGWAGWNLQRTVRGSYWLGKAERTLRADRGVEGGKRALAVLDRARAATPDDFKVRLRTAQMLVRVSRFPEAVAAARTAIAREPFQHNAWATLAGAQLGAGDAAGARASAEYALALLNDFPYPLSIEARAAEALGDQQGADAAWARMRMLAAATTGDPHTAQVAQTLLTGPEGPDSQKPPR